MFNKNSSRGQAGFVGIALLLVIIIIFSSIMLQNFVIPSQNNKEIENSEAVKAKFNSFPERVSLAVATDTQQQITFNGNIKYNEYFLLPLPTVLNRVDPIMDVNVSQEQEITIINNSGTVDEFNSDIVELHPKYHSYVVDTLSKYEQNITYEYTRESNIAINPSQQFLIEDRQITVYDVNAKEKSGEVVTLQISNTNTTTINTINPNTNSVTIQIESNLSEDQWRSLLNEELEENGGNVQSVSTTPNGDIEITLRGGREYTYTKHTITIK